MSGIPEVSTVGPSGAVYRGMNREALTEAYNNSGAVVDSPQWLERWRQRSEALRISHGTRLNMAYGSGDRQKIDYFACGVPNAPLFVFLHGGYWQRNSRDMFSFVAEGPMANGFDVAIVGYTLAPEASLQQILDECAWAIDFLLDRAQTLKLDFNPAQLIVGGWSAGGHLAAALLAGEHRLKGALAISGIFDLEPISLCALNDKLGLSKDDAMRLSPLHRIEASQPALCLVFGADELPELKRQSTDYAQAALGAGAQLKLESITGCNHFSILDELYRADGRLVQCLKALTGN
ncbi:MULTISPECIES: alpha/beta hydrolase [unclassified Polaromonas]|jgi:arylformamidase|uniref:alpha/beta hydrolase n=1 Tax=unclassified Polaromonas TaxID=2638319 RepID=UPI000BC9591C|nr:MULTISPECIES: alpha/beta hydrolase [unclassified Polaromonas]OYY37368.1 MAG: alpha/beta hydrolase [Polaromonas sp. 35-63-35]OYZ21610.1 MAG: alpha/beta hydrolase [Polaromonas sp. 16-63-31]OYZ77753.1 MAG: alpha/beta hydrolase [Polaromonas sp. 24-63-21]OZA49920.1 MAG: alpha/beta hydrolase [Polaromonas sp. 17-63-33]OZA87091.1 MAG: alpha/beta hydrolase [Polaromonas sp. 39-63-25]